MQGESQMRRPLSWTLKTELMGQGWRGGMPSEQEHEQLARAKARRCEVAGMSKIQQMVWKEHRRTGRARVQPS